MMRKLDFDKENTDPQSAGAEAESREEREDASDSSDVEDSPPGSASRDRQAAGSDELEHGGEKSEQFNKHENDECSDHDSAAQTRTGRTQEYKSGSQHETAGPELAEDQDDDASEHEILGPESVDIGEDGSEHRVAGQQSAQAVTLRSTAPKPPSTAPQSPSSESNPNAEVNKRRKGSWLHRLYKHDRPESVTLPVTTAPDDQKHCKLSKTVSKSAEALPISDIKSNGHASNGQYVKSNGHGSKSKSNGHTSNGKINGDAEVSLRHSNSDRKLHRPAAMTRRSRLSLPILSRFRHQRKHVKHPSDVIIVTKVKDTPSPESAAPHSSKQRSRCSCLPCVGRSDRVRATCPLADRLAGCVSGEGASMEGHEIRNTLVVGAAFQLVFTAHFAIQNLQSSLHEEDALGVSALGCLYGTSILSSIFAPTLIGVVGAKGCLVLSWLCHLLYTSAQYYPAWATLVPASILLGLVTGPTWTVQGLYVSACAFSFSKRSEHSPYTILSRFNGLFFTLYETKNILGNLVSSFVLRDGVGNKSEGIIFKFCGPEDCPYLENVTDIEEPDAWVIDTMLTIYMGLQILALVLTIALVTPLARSEWVARVTLRDTVTSWFHTLVATEMFYLVPFMVFQSMQQGILLSEYTKSYISCPIGIHKVGFVMAAFGGVTAFFVLVFSRLARLTGRLPLFGLAASVNAALLGVMLNWTPDSDQEALIFLFPVCWGVSEAIWQTQTNAMIAVLFADGKEPAFANYQAWRAVGYTLVFSYHSFLCVSTKLAIALGFLVVGMGLYTAVEVRIRWKERVKVRRDSRHKQDQQEQKAAKRIADRMASLATPLHQPHDMERADSQAVKWTLGDADRVSSLKVSSASFKTSVSSLGMSNMSLHVSTPSVDVSTSSYPSAQRMSASEQGEGDSFSNRSSQLYSIIDEDDVPGSRSEGLMTLNGLYVSREEQAHLDNDLKRYSVDCDVVRRPNRVAQFARSVSDVGYRPHKLPPMRPYSERASPPGSPTAPWERPQSWHERSFHNQGALKIVWEKDDVFVF